MRRSIDYSSLLFLGAALMPFVLSAQTVANAPVDAALSVVAYVEIRASAAEAARMALRRYREASQPQDGIAHVDIAPNPQVPVLLARLAEASRQEPGNLRFDVVQHPMRANHFTVIEHWRS